MAAKSRFDLPLQNGNHPKACFSEELKGWHGYTEWEKYPDKKSKAAEILDHYKFAGVRTYRNILENNH